MSSFRVTSGLENTYSRGEDANAILRFPPKTLESATKPEVVAG
jgi:hypothetical protein